MSEDTRLECLKGCRKTFEVVGSRIRRQIGDVVLGQSFLDRQRTHPRNVREHMRPDHRTHLDARLEVKARCRNEPRKCGPGWRGFTKLDTRDDRLAGADAFRKRALAQAGTGASVAEEVCCRGRHA